MSALRVAQVLGEAYQVAPSSWIARYGRIDNRMRHTVRMAAKEALGRLEDIPEAERPEGYWGAEQALLTMRRVGEGVDPRGGKERDQMRYAMDDVAREMSHMLARVEWSS